MSGGLVGAGGQQVTAWQSAGVGGPALKEKSTLASCGSIPSGGSVMAGPATSAKVYVDKSPVSSRLTVTTVGSCAVASVTDTA